jgi:hypothetical protein
LADTTITDETGLDPADDFVHEPPPEWTAGRKTSSGTSETKTVSA